MPSASGHVLPLIRTQAQAESNSNLSRDRDPPFN